MSGFKHFNPTFVDDKSCKIKIYNTSSSSTATLSGTPNDPGSRSSWLLPPVDSSHHLTPPTRHTGVQWWVECSPSSRCSLFTADRRMPEMATLLFFFSSFEVVRDVAPHANVLIIESQGDNSRRLFGPLATLLMLCSSWNVLWLRHKWNRGRKHRLENTLEAAALEPVVSLGAVGDFWASSNCCCCYWVQIPRLLSCEKVPFAF